MVYIMICDVMTRALKLRDATTLNLDLDYGLTKIDGTNMGLEKNPKPDSNLNACVKNAQQNLPYFV